MAGVEAHVLSFHPADRHGADRHGGAPAEARPIASGRRRRRPS
jgi:hypothetical protein